ncbi:uncharacterized protein LOC62_04G006527 [Vanrija pseudolonga]|uniref:Uncharacterized protein n=1 Tax=Vanrija pseudolonga TaxID=143232 RepID=A0AAF0YGF5_9TREE|nr:hypothetical protein LOC62_04G006527 [Vanrija pseudolonga]
MKIKNGFWRDWEVSLEYENADGAITEHNPDFISAERTGNRDLRVVYVEVAEVDVERPFRIVARAPRLIDFDLKMESVIDGRKLGIPRAGHKATVLRDSRWVDRDCDGVHYDRNYKFSPLLFIVNGPTPKQLRYYGSITVTLEGGKLAPWKMSPPSCTGQKPLGILDEGAKERIGTDLYVDGSVIGPTMPTNRAPFKADESIPEGAVVFKVSAANARAGGSCQYGTGNALTRNGFTVFEIGGGGGGPRAQPALRRSLRLIDNGRGTTYGGNNFERSETPLTVVYDPKDESGTHRSPKRRRTAK